MTVWRDDLDRSVSPGWGNSWTTSPSNTRWYTDGTNGIHRKYIPGTGTGSYGVMERILPLNVVGTEQEVLFGFRNHYSPFDSPPFSYDDRLDFYLQDGNHSAFSAAKVRVRIEFGTLNIRVYKPLLDVDEDYVFDPDLVPADTDMLVRFSVGPSSIQAKIWIASDPEPGWQITAPLTVDWVGGTYVWFDPFGTPGINDDTDDDYGKFIVNFVQVSVPNPLIPDSRIFYREGWA